ncbi:MAG TPA: glycine betaine ABC transporter substrate-binding protein, partial [Terriglobales bacterium]|nr:glycine betaine ABC transporter substrate-binding protein [Terriglobales bacterium]
MITRLLAIVAALGLMLSCLPSRENRIVIGSKNFTEQLILGELIAQHSEAKNHLPVERRFYLAGT